MNIGDKATRVIAGTVNMPVIIGQITGDTIKVGSADGIIPWEIGWTFNRKTLLEIDDELGWDGITTSGSFLLLN